LGFDEAFDFTQVLHDVTTELGTTRLVLEKPYQGRLPIMHRLDIALERPIELPFGWLDIQAGAINTYDRQNMFYYDLFTAKRVDQLPLTPYLSLKLRTE
jgi:hypothetical protein